MENFWFVLFIVFNAIILLSLVFTFATREQHQKEVDEDERLVNEMKKLEDETRYGTKE